MASTILLLLAAVGFAAADKASSLPVLYRVDQDHSNVVVFRGADVAKAAAAGLIKGYKPAPAPAYKPTPAPYVPPPTTTYAPPTTTRVYTTPKPAPIYKPAPVVYKPAPVVYKPAPVVYKPAPVVYKPTYNEPHYADVEPNYTWEYAVKDYSYNDFGHKESRDHYLAQGKYYVALPDGRFQTVTYTADENGYRPVVEYTGEASYPDEHPKAGYQA